MADAFIPKSTKKNTCKDQETRGLPSVRYDYPTKALTGDIDYPTDWGACDPHLHMNMRLQGLKVMTDFQSIGPAIFDTTIKAGGKVTAPTFVGNVSGCFGVPAGCKSFDIPHVTQRGKRIRHICVEGPEAGIYIRGRLTRSNVIQLPEYWDGLINPETITVTLTQIKTSQDLIVDDIRWGKEIIIKSGNASTIDCFYEVWAARWIDVNDMDKQLHVVYEGETPADYPDGNDGFIVGGYNDKIQFTNDVYLNF